MYTDTELIMGCLLVWILGIVAAAIVAAAL